MSARAIVNAILLLCVLALIALAFGSCRSSRAATRATADSVRVEVRQVTRLEPDTVDVPLTPSVKEVITPDTFSVLSNDFSESVVEVLDGKIRHALSVRDTVVRLKVQRQVITRDSVVYRDRLVEREVKAPLSTWARIWRVVPFLLALALWWEWRYWKRKMKRYS